MGWSKVWDGASLTACSSSLGGEEVLRDNELLVIQPRGTDQQSLQGEALRFPASFTPMPGGPGVQEPASCRRGLWAGRGTGP